jgi:hypothetical protein
MASCRNLFTLCSDCDRGNQYCSSVCSNEARRISLRLAGVRHQRSPEGARDHADRQARFRERQKIVTHQGSAQSPLLLQLPSPEPESVMVTVTHGSGSEVISERIQSTFSDLCDSGSTPSAGAGISGGPSRGDPDESSVQLQTDSPQGAPHVVGSTFNVDGHSGPMCSCCGARGTLVRYGFLRRVWRRERSNPSLSNRSG